MSSYVYELPTTGAISFTDFCVDQTASYTTAIASATQARANLRAALKESKRTASDPGSEKDYLRLVKVVDDYLPYLYAIKACFDADELILSKEPVFSWRTTLSSNLFNNSPRQDVSSLGADLAFTLLTYGMCLSNLSRSNVAALGSYEHERSTTDIERKAKDEKLNFAVNLLCRASGLFRYLSEELLPEWERTGTSPATRPPDITQPVTSALSKLALADAQTLAIRKLLSKAAYDNSLTPGPPLPKSHPSPALIAKLYLECEDLYASARALVKSQGKAKGHENEEVTAELRHYLADEAQLSGALARKWLGVDVGEHGGGEKCGQAIAFLIWAKAELEDLKDGGKGLIGRAKEIRERRKAKVATELASTALFLKYYKNMNDTIHFQPVPPRSELQASIPAGRSAVAIKPYKPPAPAFGPGSVEHLRRQAESLELEDDDVRSHSKSPTSPPSSQASSSSYAGAGSYF